LTCADVGDRAQRLGALSAHHAELRRCRDCPRMTGPPVHGEAVLSPVLLLGQAPGTREIEQGRPFCWTAGKTLFGWFGGIGLAEQGFRQRVYMSAVCRCFPVPLPHPSGASAWFKTEPGLSLLPRALELIGAHPAWQAIVGDQSERGGMRP
jgi:uracil-DNA glycosylase family 4